MTHAGIHPQPPEAAAEQRASDLDARYRAPLMSYFRRRLHTPQDAEDLTQEVFLRILRRDEALPSDHAEAYLFQVAANLLRDRARQAGWRRANDHVSLDGPEGPGLTADPASSGLIEDLGPERVLLSQEALAAALAALDQLGERTRDIFVLYRLEKMKHREIAALYGISVSSVEKYVARASEHLSLAFGPL